MNIIEISIYYFHNHVTEQQRFRIATSMTKMLQQNQAKQ